MFNFIWLKVSLDRIFPLLNNHFRNNFGSSDDGWTLRRSLNITIVIIITITGFSYVVVESD